MDAERSEFLASMITILERLQQTCVNRGEPLLASVLAIAKGEAEDAQRHADELKSLNTLREKMSSQRSWRAADQLRLAADAEERKRRRRSPKPTSTKLSRMTARRARAATSPRRWRRRWRKKSRPKLQRAAKSPLEGRYSWMSAATWPFRAEPVFSPSTTTMMRVSPRFAEATRL